MKPLKARRLSLRVTPGTTVSALYQQAPRASAFLVLAHGAGAGMSHPFMTAVADLLAERGVSTLRFQFPYMEAGSKRPDRPVTAHAAVRAAVKKAAKLAPALPLFAGGKSFWRSDDLPRRRRSSRYRMFVAWCSWGFLFTCPDKPSVDRAEHLLDIRIPQLFVQGTRDALAQPALLRGVVRRLEAGQTLASKRRRPFLRCPGASGRNHQEVLAEIAQVLTTWIKSKNIG